MAKFLDGTGLADLLNKIKNAFVAKTDTAAATGIDIDSTPTANSSNLVTSGGVKAALDGKQNTISDLSTIRSGASAGATAYQKPSTGIPASDLASGVIPTVTVTDVTVGGTSVVSNGTAAVPAIPTVDTNPTSASTNAVSSGGVYSALADKANVVTVGSSMPSGGFLPNVYYSLGTVSGSVTWSLASSSSAADEYMLEFTAASTAPTITWPSGITWFGGSAPSLTGGKTYQVSIQNNLAVCAEF